MTGLHDCKKKKKKMVDFQFKPLDGHLFLPYLGEQLFIIILLEHRIFQFGFKELKP